MTSFSAPVLIDGVTICSQPGRSITSRSGSRGNARRAITITSSSRSITCHRTGTAAHLSAEEYRTTRKKCLNPRCMKNQVKLFGVALLLIAAAPACKKGGGGGDKIGVAECDDWIAKMNACAAKNTGMIGDSLKKQVDMMSKAWKEDASKPEMKDALGKTCKEAVQNMATNGPKQGITNCDWGVAAAAPKAPEGGSGSAPAADGSAAAGSGSGSAAK